MIGVDCGNNGKEVTTVSLSSLAPLASAWSLRFIEFTWSYRVSPRGIIILTGNLAFLNSHMVNRNKSEMFDVSDKYVNVCHLPPLKVFCVLLLV
jgi:hypothetical protein